MDAKWHNAEIIKVLDETPQVKRFFFKVPDLEEFNFIPGQFITLDLPIHEVKNRRYRSYSIASFPDGTNVFELIIVLVEDGLGTPWLWENGHPGKVIPFMGPIGKFVLPDEIESDLCFICTGTGIAPFRSMVNDLFHNRSKNYQNIDLIFGTRYMSDILYHDEMRTLMEKMPNFNYTVCLSREPKTGIDRPYLTCGYVHKVYEKQYRNNKPVEFYLCGWENMVKEARQNILNMGYSSDNFHVEIYG